MARTKNLRESNKGLAVVSITRGLSNTLPFEDRALLNRLSYLIVQANKFESKIIKSYPPGRDGLYHPHAIYIARVLESYCAALIKQAKSFGADTDQTRMIKLLRLYRVTIPSMRDSCVAAPYIKFTYGYFRPVRTEYAKDWMAKKATQRNNNFDGYVRLAHIPWAIVNSIRYWVGDIKRHIEHPTYYLTPTRTMAVQLTIALVAQIDNLIRQLRRGDFSATDPSPYMNGGQ